MIQNFKQIYNLTPCIGVEIEFYLYNVQSINKLLKNSAIKIIPELGKNQFEFELPATTDIANYPDLIIKSKKYLQNLAMNHQGIIDFDSKPFRDDFGSSMHIHLNFLEDEKLANGSLDKYARILCHYLPETIHYFLPRKKDYNRLDSKFMAPTHISYGNNNRTVMIRIPDSNPKRLEHRLAAANANPYLVIYAILNSIFQGIPNYNKINKLAKVYGNAFDPEYNLMVIKEL